MSATRSSELLEAIRNFLREDVQSELSGIKAYNTRIAHNALGIVARELEQGAALVELDGEMARRLGLDEQAGPIGRQIALGLKDGTLEMDAVLMEYLKKRTVAALAIDNPKYSGLQQARERWPV